MGGKRLSLIGAKHSGLGVRGREKGKKRGQVIKSSASFRARGGINGDQHQGPASDKVRAQPVMQVGAQCVARVTVQCVTMVRP